VIEYPNGLSYIPAWVEMFPGESIHKLGITYREAKLEFEQCYNCKIIHNPNYTLSLKFNREADETWFLLKWS
jgi:hypothetical protein